MDYKAPEKNKVLAGKMGREQTTTKKKLSETKKGVLIVMDQHDY